MLFYLVSISADHIYNDMTAYIMDSTKSHKDTDIVLNEIMADLLEMTNGQKAVGFIFDCGPLNHNPAVCQAFITLLIDIGMFEVSFVILLQKYHSKQLADMFLGRIEKLSGKLAMIGIDSIMHWIERIVCCKETGICCCASKEGCLLQGICCSEFAGQ